MVHLESILRLIFLKERVAVTRVQIYAILSKLVVYVAPLKIVILSLTSYVDKGWFRLDLPPP